MKTYGIIGLGKFGSVVADELIKAKENVIIADKDEEKLTILQDRVNHAYILDSTNTVALKEAGFHNVDIVIVSIGENVEKSILTLMALKDIGVKTVITKATSLIHGQILSKLGSTRVIYPEKESAIRLAKEFLTQSEAEIINLSANTIRAIKIIINEKLEGQSLKQIAKNLKIIALKQEMNNWTLFPDLETTILSSGDIVILLGLEEELEEFMA